MDQQERAVGLCHGPSRFAAGIERGDRCCHRNPAMGGNQRRDVRDPVDVDRPGFGVEPQPARQVLADLIAVQQGDLVLATCLEIGDQRLGDGGLPGA